LVEVGKMNRHDSALFGGQEAVLDYGDGEFAVLKPGEFVRCAVTGARIPLDALRYWSVDLNEAYASPEAVLARLKSPQGRR
jgi:hypothetical protein